MPQPAGPVHDTGERCLGSARSGDGESGPFQPLMTVLPVRSALGVQVPPGADSGPAGWPWGMVTTEGKPGTGQPQN